MKKGGMLCVLLAALLVFLCAFPVSAGNSTANTYTVSVNWEWIKTQDAYLPGQVYFKDEGLNRPSDIVVMNMKMYVADSDNGRILIKDLNDREKPTEILGEGIVNRPTGIYVTADGTIYVADAGSKTVVVGILGVLVYLFDYVYRGFIFNHNSLRYTQYTVVLATVVIPVVLWAICNYMIATIHAGDGTFKKVFRSTIYAFSPYILITPFTTILSMFLTNDEGFILTIISNVVVVWVVITLFLFIKKVQDFTFWETVKNILITIFLIIVILIAAALIYSLWNSISEFLVSVYREVFYRGLNK